LNTTCTAKNFQNDIEHSFTGTIAGLYDSLDEERKKVLRMIEIPGVMSKKLCKEIKIEFIDAELDFEEKAIESQRKINNVKI